jgi:hypothetical protein
MLLLGQETSGRNMEDLGTAARDRKPTADATSGRSGNARA